jgi:hypothetical protein
MKTLISYAMAMLCSSLFGYYAVDGKTAAKRLADDPSQNPHIWRDGRLTGDLPKWKVLHKRYEVIIPTEAPVSQRDGWRVEIRSLVQTVEGIAEITANVTVPKEALGFSLGVYANDRLLESYDHPGGGEFGFECRRQFIPVTKDATLELRLVARNAGADIPDWRDALVARNGPVVASHTHKCKRRDDPLTALNLPIFEEWSMPH